MAIIVPMRLAKLIRIINAVRNYIFNNVIHNGLIAKCQHSFINIPSIHLIISGWLIWGCLNTWSLPNTPMIMPLGVMRASSHQPSAGAVVHSWRHRVSDRRRRRRPIEIEPSAICSAVHWEIDTFWKRARVGALGGGWLERRELNAKRIVNKRRLQASSLMLYVQFGPIILGPDDSVSSFLNLFFLKAKF